MSAALAAAWGWVLEQWPGVYPNLIASAIQGVAVYLWARWHVRKLHHRLDLLDRVHHHLTKKEGNEPQGH